ncbi:MAG: hypothetical protein KME64_28485 [Scytonematopsis contorta HA4267-MV1]|nr:hypothetical protein [Scytonematopsis contorta HA4267-MV1]
MSGDNIVHENYLSPTIFTLLLPNDCCNGNNAEPLRDVNLFETPEPAGAIFLSFG